MANRLNVLLYDIETAPIEARLWHPAQGWVPQEMVREDFFMLTWAAKWYGDDEIVSARATPKEVLGRSDERIVEKLAKMMRRADVLLAHNGDKFDRPKVNARLAKHQLEPLGPKNSIDPLKLARKHLGVSHKNLDYLARYFGGEGKIEVHWSLWERVLDGPDRGGALKEMETYNRRDVDQLDFVFTRIIPYVDRLTRLYEATQVDEDICLYCGSEESERRGTYRTQSGNFAKIKCLNCGKYRRGRGHIPTQRAAGHPL